MRKSENEHSEYVVSFHLKEYNQMIKIVRNIADIWLKVVHGLMSEAYLESSRTSTVKLFSENS